MSCDAGRDDVRTGAIASTSASRRPHCREAVGKCGNSGNPGWRAVPRNRSPGNRPQRGLENGLPGRRTAHARRRERRQVRPRRRYSPRCRAVGHRPPARSRRRPGSPGRRSARLCQGSRSPARSSRLTVATASRAPAAGRANAGEPATSPTSADERRRVDTLTTGSTLDKEPPAVRLSLGLCDGRAYRPRRVSDAPERSFCRSLSGARCRN